MKRILQSNLFRFQLIKNHNKFQHIKLFLFNAHTFPSQYHFTLLWFLLFQWQTLYTHLQSTLHGSALLLPLFMQLRLKNMPFIGLNKAEMLWKCHFCSLNILKDQQAHQQSHIKHKFWTSLNHYRNYLKLHQFWKLHKFLCSQKHQIIQHNYILRICISWFPLFLQQMLFSFLLYPHTLHNHFHLQ